MAGPKSSGKYAVALVAGVLLLLQCIIPATAADTVIQVRTVKPGPYETFPRWNSSLSVNWKWEDPLGREITVQRLYNTGSAIYTDRWTLDGTSKTSIQYLFRKDRGPETSVFVVNQLDPRQNTKVEITFTAGNDLSWLDPILEYNPHPNPLGITTRVVTMPTGRYTQIVIGNPEFTDPPDHIYIEYRQYTADEWTMFAQTEIDPLLPEFTYYGDGTDLNYVPPGYYRARYAWMPAPEDPAEPLYSAYVETGQVGPSFAPSLTYPDVVLPDAPTGIELDPTVNPFGHIWESNIGTTFAILVAGVIGTAVAAYFVYGRA